MKGSLTRSRTIRGTTSPADSPQKEREPFSLSPFRQKTFPTAGTPGRRSRPNSENVPPDGGINLPDVSSPLQSKSSSKGSRNQGASKDTLAGSPALPPRPPRQSPARSAPSIGQVDSGTRGLLSGQGQDQLGGAKRRINWDTQSGGTVVNVVSTSTAVVSGADTGVKVIVRMRPLNKKEEGEEASEIVHKVSTTSVSLGDQQFTYDAVAAEDASQQSVFQMVGLPMVENCLAGFNSSIFAYGQTGSGKTHTMWGSMPDSSSDLPSENRGLTPRVFEEIFARIHQEEKSNVEKQLQYQCRCSFLEIYNEQITDLLEPSQKNLMIREDTKTGVYVDNLTEEYVSSVEDVNQLLRRGLANTRVAATTMNNESSRSHRVFTCVIESRSKIVGEGVCSLRSSRINLVDLAGSERQKQTGAAGERLKEAGNINRSLSQLGNVINILAEVAQSGKQRHIPYRDSRLTFLLQESLGGNAKLAMICAISPASSCRIETLSTLRFAQRAKAMRNKAVVNEETANDVNLLREQIRQLKDELVRMKSNNAQEGGSGGGYSNGWNARRSYNLLRLSLKHPMTFPLGDSECMDEEMVTDEDAVETEPAVPPSFSTAYNDIALDIQLKETVISPPKEVEIKEGILCKANPLSDVTPESEPQPDNFVENSTGLPSQSTSTSLCASDMNTGLSAMDINTGLSSLDINTSLPSLDNSTSLPVLDTKNFLSVPEMTELPEVRHCIQPMNCSLSPQMKEEEVVEEIRLCGLIPQAGEILPSWSKPLPTLQDCEPDISLQLDPIKGALSHGITFSSPTDVKNSLLVPEMTELPKLSPSLQPPTPSLSPRAKGEIKEKLPMCGLVPLKEEEILPSWSNQLPLPTLHNSEPDVSLHLIPVNGNSSLRSSLRISKIFSSPRDRLAASLHRGLEILDNHQQSSLRRSSAVRFSFQNADLKVARRAEKGVQTSPEVLVCNCSARLPLEDKVFSENADSKVAQSSEIGVQTSPEKLVNCSSSLMCLGEGLECSDPTTVVEGGVNTSLSPSSDRTQWQLVAMEMPSKSLSVTPASKGNFAHAIEAVLAGAIRRERAAEEAMTRQAAEIEQLNRLMRQYKHERECNSILQQSREDKIARLEALMDGILPGDAFLNEEWSALLLEHKTLQEKFDKHPEVTHAKVEQERLLEELQSYRTFFDLGEREVLQQEVMQLRNHLLSYIDTGTPGSAKHRRLSLNPRAILPRSPRHSTADVAKSLSLCVVTEATSSSDFTTKELQLAVGKPLASDCWEEEQKRWEEREREWIVVLEEMREESESYRQLAEKRKVELEGEKRCAQEVHGALEMAMEGHARLLEQYAELQEKHIALLAKQRKIREGVTDLKKVAKRAGVTAIEARWFEAQSEQVVSLRVEREHEANLAKEEIKGLQAQLRDTADAVQAAGELLMRLKEAEEAVCMAQDAAAMAGQEANGIRREMEKLTRRHATEMATLQQRLLESRLQKSTVCPMCVMAERVKFEFTEVDAETAQAELEAEARATACKEANRIPSPGKRGISSSWNSGQQFVGEEEEESVAGEFEDRGFYLENLDIDNFDDEYS